MCGPLGSGGDRVKQSVSGPVAIVVVLLALVVLAALFSNPRLAPPEPTAPATPWEPPFEEQQMTAMRQGLKPLGISAVLPPLAEDRRSGARVSSILPKGPAFRAGVRIGDRIESFNGKRVTHPMGLGNLLANVKPTEAYPMVVLRAGKQQTLMVTGITPLPPEEQPGQ